MIQVFILGSSYVYGVGAEKSGWADLLKQSIHQKMYGEDGVGEKYEVYNFGKSGAEIKFVQKTFPQQFEQYSRGGKIITILSVGGNNTKAENKPDNFISTPEEYSEQMEKLLDLLKNRSSQVIVVGSSFYDESKTNPKSNPLTGGKSYFSNQRKEIFESKLKKICAQKQITFIDIDVSQSEWQEKYLSNDGLHPNQTGHELIAKKILAKINI